jgi:hypothetical protein
MAGGSGGAGAVGVSEQQVRRADQHRGEGGDVGAGRDPAQVTLGFEVTGGHGHRLGDQGDAGAGGGAQLVAREDRPARRLALTGNVVSGARGVISRSVRDLPDVDFHRGPA